MWSPEQALQEWGTPEQDPSGMPHGISSLEIRTNVVPEYSKAYTAVKSHPTAMTVNSSPLPGDIHLVTQ